MVFVCPQKKMKKLLILSLCGFLSLTARSQEASADRPSYWAQPIQLEGVPNLHQIGPGLYRSAQPSSDGMQKLRELGVGKVLNLRSLHSDRDELDGTGLEYEHIRMVTWHPEREDILRFLRIVSQPNRAPLLVHCQYGADRTGMICAVYRIAVQGWSKEAAIQEMTQGQFGFHQVCENLLDWIQALDVESLRKEAGITSLAQQMSPDPTPGATILVANTKG